MQSTYTFSPLDEIMPPLRYTLIFCFSCVDDEREQIFSTLSSALKQLVRKRPCLTSTIIRENSNEPGNGARPGHLSLAVADEFEAPKLIYKDLTLSEHSWADSYEQLQTAGMPLSKLNGLIFAPVPYGMQAPGDKAMTFQATFVSGGCFLSASSVHNFVDAYGLLVVMHECARYSRIIQNPFLGIVESTKGHSQLYDGKANSLDQRASSQDYEILRHRPELWRLLGLDWRKGGFKPAPFSTPSDVNTSIFAVDRAGVAAIRHAATPVILQDGSPQPSSNDALIAILWRSIIKARCPPDGTRYAENSMVSIAIDGRNALCPEVPTSHIGNVVFCGLTEQPIKFLTDPGTSLQEIALALRESLDKNRQPEILADAVKLASCIPDVRQLGNAFRGWFEEDLVTTSGAEMPFASLDFGPILGIPDFFRFPAGQFAGICMILPRKADGTYEVVVSVRDEQMKRLIEDVDFMKYFRFLSR